MALDYSALSDDELAAIAGDDYSALSEGTLQMLASDGKGETASITTGGEWKGVIPETIDSFKRAGSSVMRGLHSGAAGTFDFLAGIPEAAGKVLPYIVPGSGALPNVQALPQQMEAISQPFRDVANTQRQVAQTYAQPRYDNKLYNIPQDIMTGLGALPTGMLPIVAGAATGVPLPLAFGGSGMAQSLGRGEELGPSAIEGVKQALAGKVFGDAAKFTRPVQAAANVAAGTAMAGGDLSAGVTQAALGLTGPKGNYGFRDIARNLPEAFTASKPPLVNPLLELYGPQIMDGLAAKNLMGPQPQNAPIVDPSRLLPARTEIPQGKPILIPPSGSAPKGVTPVAQPSSRVFTPTEPPQFFTSGANGAALPVAQVSTTNILRNLSLDRPLVQQTLADMTVAKGNNAPIATASGLGGGASRMTKQTRTTTSQAPNAFIPENVVNYLEQNLGLKIPENFVAPVGKGTRIIASEQPIPTAPASNLGAGVVPKIGVQTPPSNPQLAPGKTVTTDFIKGTGQGGSILGPSLADGANPQLRESFGRPVVNQAMPKTVTIGGVKRNVSDVKNIKRVNDRFVTIGDQTFNIKDLPPEQQRIISSRLDKADLASAVQTKEAGFVDNLVKQRRDILKSLGDEGKYIVDAEEAALQDRHRISGELYILAAPEGKVKLSTKSQERIAKHRMGEKLDRPLTPEEAIANKNIEAAFKHAADIAVKDGLLTAEQIKQGYWPEKPDAAYKSYLINHKSDWVQNLKKNNPKLSDMEIGKLYDFYTGKSSVVESGNIVFENHKAIPRKHVRKDFGVLGEYFDDFAQHAAEQKHYGKDYALLKSTLANLDQNGRNEVMSAINAIESEARRSGKMWKWSNVAGKIATATTYTPITGYVGNLLSVTNNIYARGSSPVTAFKALVEVLDPRQWAAINKEAIRLGQATPFSNTPKSLTAQAGYRTKRALGKAADAYLTYGAGFVTETPIIKFSNAVGKRVINNLLTRVKTATGSKKAMYSDMLEYYGINPKKAINGEVTQQMKDNALRTYTDMLQNNMNSLMRQTKWQAGGPIQRTLGRGVSSATRGAQLTSTILRDAFKYPGGATAGAALMMLIAQQISGYLKGAAIDAVYEGDGEDRGLVKSTIRNQALGAGGGPGMDLINQVTSGRPKALFGLGGLVLGRAADVVDSAGRVVTRKKLRDVPKQIGKEVVRNLPTKILLPKVFPDKKKSW